MILFYCKITGLIDSYFIKIYYLKKRFEMLSKREQHEKDLKALMTKPIGNKNPIFEEKFINELHSMFSLYADPRQRRA